jgi:hypothetical protein
MGRGCRDLSKFYYILVTSEQSRKAVYETASNIYNHNKTNHALKWGIMRSKLYVKLVIVPLCLPSYEGNVIYNLSMLCMKYYTHRIMYDEVWEINSLIGKRNHCGVLCDACRLNAPGWLAISLPIGATLTRLKIILGTLPQKPTINYNL